MTTKKHLPRFIPLFPISANNNESVLYYDSHASPEAAAKYINTRINAISNLFGDLQECNNVSGDVMPAIRVVSDLLLKDTILLARAIKAKAKA